MQELLTSKWTKLVVFMFCAMPAVELGLRAYQDQLGPNPVEFITHFTGDFTIIFLCLTLAITPARKVLHMPALIRFRRMLGLFAFFYVSLHFLCWFVIDKYFDFGEMWHDVHKRPFITVGFTGFVLLIPLAVTSTSGWIRRLGGKRWQALHRLIYVTAVCGVIHYYWLVKSDIRKPVMYGAIVALLLGYRAYTALARRSATAAPRATASVRT